MSKPLELGAMKVEQAVVELRHPPAFLLWDRAGSVWRNVQKGIPGIEPTEAQPNVTRFKLPPNDDFQVELENHRIISANPDRKLTEIKSRAAIFSRTVIDTLEIQQLKRVGLRVIYSLATSTVEEASELVLRKKLLRTPQSLVEHPPFPGRLTLPEVAFRYEGKAIGITCRLRAETRNYELNIPPNFQSDMDVKSFKKTSHLVTLDLDYYTMVSMGREQLLISEWLESGFRVLKREADRMLEGRVE